MEQLIISCYDPTQLRMLLIKTSSKSLSRSVWKINPCWELPIPLQSVLVSMPKGFLQDYSFVLLAKSRELMLSKNWKLSLEFLKILTAEIQQGNGNYIAKLSRLISWEALLIKINQLLEEWPAPNLGNYLHIFAKKSIDFYLLQIEKNWHRSAKHVCRPQSLFYHELKLWSTAPYVY